MNKSCPGRNELTHKHVPSWQQLNLKKCIVQDVARKEDPYVTKAALKIAHKYTLTQVLKKCLFKTRFET